LLLAGPLLLATPAFAAGPVIDVTPSGAPVTGDGTTSSATGGPFTTAGLALLAAGGLAAGVVVVRGRRAGTRS